MVAPNELARRVEAAEPTDTVMVEATRSFVQWSAVVAGAFVAAALSLVLISFGSAIGLAILSSSPTWRDASPALAVGSGLYMLLTALVSFGLGGYLAGRLRQHWGTTIPSEAVEFRDGVHGVLAWAIAAVVSGLVITASLAGVASKTVEPATSPAATTGKPLIAYELDRLFRAERHPPQADLTYSRAEAGRILLAATGQQGITPEDRTYLARLVAATTGIAQPVPNAAWKWDHGGNGGGPKKPAAARSFSAFLLPFRYCSAPRRHGTPHSWAAAIGETSRQL